MDSWIANFDFIRKNKLFFCHFFSTEVYAKKIHEKLSENKFSLILMNILLKKMYKRPEYISLV